MTSDPFYKSHWKDVDENRMAGYRSSFKWTDAAAPLYEAAQFCSGQVVADFGCGPGFVAIELARRVGPAGHVHAIDINPEFLEQTLENARAAGMTDRISTHRSDGVTLPLPNASLDRISARNTIMYVDDPVHTFREFHRVLRPGGKMHAIDGDRFMMVMEPVQHDLWRAFVKAAAHVCKNADMGRKLYGAVRAAGFENINAQIISTVDTDGRSLSMVNNMAKYARLSGELPESDINEVLEAVRNAVEDGSYLAVSPQFVVVGDRSIDL